MYACVKVMKGARRHVQLVHLKLVMIMFANNDDVVDDRLHALQVCDLFNPAFELAFMIIRLAWFQRLWSEPSAPAEYVIAPTNRHFNSSARY